MAARQQASVLFADIVGYSQISEARGPEDAYSIVTRCLQLLDGVARRHGGAVDKYLGDCLMVVFGIPVAAENSALQAARAAAEMRQLVQDYRREQRLDLPLDLQVGINTGLLVVGDVGGTVVREFAVMGDAVNVAARLKDRAAPGRIFIGPDTYASTRDIFRYRPLATLKLKGKQDSVATYELVETRDDSAPRVGSSALVYSGLVGRDRELAVLTRAASRAAEGIGVVVAIRGEAGIGKSRLTAELAASSEASGLWFLELHPGGFAQSERRLRAALARGPGVLVLEDLQQADDSDLDILATLFDHSAHAPLLVLALLRSGHALADRVLDQLRALGTDRHQDLSLVPLDPAAVGRLMDELQDEHPLTPESRILVAKRASGNPREVILAASLSSALRADAERDLNATRSSESERRRTTVLFADISGFTSMSEQMDPHEAHALVTDCLTLLDSVARKHGGSVDKHLGDCIMATYGVPVAIEDAPKAAVNAALEMRQRVSEFNEERDLEPPLEVHTGIDTGLGIAGDISGPLIREYALMGDSVNVASRLKDIAPPGRIYVGPETHRTTRHEFEYEQRDPIQLKGRTATVSTYELLSTEVRIHRTGVGSHRGVVSEMVGREPELEALRERIQMLSTGEGSIVSIVGEAGLGKSRLLAELAKSEEVEGVTWLEGRSLFIGRGLSFHPFADLLGHLCEIEESDDDARALRKLEETVQRLLGEESEEILPFVCRILGMSVPDRHRERLEKITGEGFERLVQASTTRLLRGLSAERPLVLVFDDLHWADLSSIDLLEPLLRLSHTDPILFVNVFRPHFEETSERVLAQVRKRHSERSLEIQLQPLDKQAARRLIRNLFRGGDIPRETRAAIEEQAGGNPFFVEEVVRSLLDEGAVELHDGVLRATEKIFDVEIPGTIQEVVMARIDRLDPARRNVLQVASVIGGSFHFEVLSEVVGKEDLEELVASLVDAEMFSLGDRTHGREYAFKHPLFHEVALDSILQVRRESLHLAIGRAIETELTQSVAGYHASLAYHFSRGGDPERAEAYLFQAGDEAARSAASNEALHFFQEASQIYLELHGSGGDPEKKAILEGHIGQALFNRGQLLEAVDHYNFALVHLGENVPESGVEVALRVVPMLLAVLFRLYRPRQKSAATLLQRRVIELMFARSQAQSTTDPTRFVFDTMDALRHVQQVDPKSVERSGAMYSAPAGTFAYGGISFGISQKFLDVATDLVPADDPGERLFFGVMNYLHHLLEGDWSADHTVANDLLNVGLGLGRLWEVTNYLDLDTERGIYRGEFTRTRERIEEMRRIADLYQYDLAKASHEALTAFLFLEERKLPEALDAAEHYYEEHSEVSFQLLALGTKAKALVHQGELAAAERVMDLAEALIARSGSLLPFHVSNYWRSRLLLDVASYEVATLDGQGPGMRRLRKRCAHSVRKAVAVAGKVASRRPEVFQLAGTWHWLSGRKKRALDFWRRSLKAGADLGTHPQLARTWIEVGSRLTSESGDGPASLDGVVASEFLARAEMYFQKKHLEWDLGELARRSGGRH